MIPLTPRSLHAVALAAIAGPLLWLGLIVALHVIKPRLKPALRMVSEYARPPHGWIMQLAFYGMAIGCLALVVAGWLRLDHSGLLMLAIVGLAFAGAGIFVTDPLYTAPANMTLHGMLHNIAAFTVILLFPFMATRVSLDREFIGGARVLLLTLAGLTWVGSAGFIVAAVRAAIAHAKEGADVRVGLYQRGMILMLTLWLIAAAVILAAGDRIQ
jgi:hypothetical protein